MPKEECGTEDPDSFEDILKIVGSSGPKHKWIISLTAFVGMVIAIDSFSYVFLGKTPKFHCQNEYIQRANWTFDQKIQISTPLKANKDPNPCEIYTAPYDLLYEMSYEKAHAYMEGIKLNLTVVPCERREFEGEVISTVTQWDLVCERRVLYSSTQACVQVGKLLGSLVFGFFSDKYGRKPTFQLSLICFVACSFGVTLSSGVWIFMLIRLMASFFSVGVGLSSYVLTMELILTKHRHLVGSLANMPWGIGFFYLAAVAYYIHTWYLLQLLLCLPSLVLFLGFWIFPESPRWLIINNKFDRAMTIVKEFATSNKRSLPDKSKVTQIMEHIYCEHKSSLQKSSISSDAGSCSRILEYLKSTFILLVDRRFRRVTITILFCWFSVSVVYYGVSLGNPSPGTAMNDYLYTAIGGVIEIVASILPWIMLAYWGRRRTVTWLYLICAAAILTSMMLIILEKNIEYIGIQWCLYNIGRLSITAAFVAIMLFTVELYPTSYRGIALGSASMMARLSSISSSYINDILGSVVFWAPSAVFGIISALSATAIMTLPETMNKELPDFAGQNQRKTGCHNTAMETVE